MEDLEPTGPDRALPAVLPARSTLHTHNPVESDHPPAANRHTSSIQRQSSIPHHVHVSTTIPRTGRNQHRNLEGEMQEQRRRAASSER